MELHCVVQIPLERQCEAGDDPGRRSRAVQVGIEWDTGFGSRQAERSNHQEECPYRIQYSKTRRSSHFQTPIVSANSLYPPVPRHHRSP